MDLNFYNKYHLGDQIYHIHFCNKLLQKYPHLRISNYMYDEYKISSDLHVYPENKYRIKNIGIDNGGFSYIDLKNYNNCWINRKGIFDKWVSTPSSGYLEFDVFYIDFYIELLAELGLESPILNRDDFWFDNPEITKTDEHFDFLLINSVPMSGQWYDNNGQFDEISTKLIDSGYSVISTAKSRVPDVVCTLDRGYSLLDIAKVSTGVDHVIGIHTSPFLVTLNHLSVDTVKSFICLHRQGLTYSLENVHNIKSDYKEVYNILSSYGVKI